MQGGRQSVSSSNSFEPRSSSARSAGWPKRDGGAEQASSREALELRLAVLRIHNSGVDIAACTGRFAHLVAGKRAVWRNARAFVTEVGVVGSRDDSGKALGTKF